MAEVTYAGHTWPSARAWCLSIMQHNASPGPAQDGQQAALDAFAAEERAAALREGAEALRAENRRILWATKPETCAEAEFLDRMADALAAAGQAPAACWCADIDERLRPCEPCKYADLGRRLSAGPAEARATAQAPAPQPETAPDAADGLAAVCPWWKCHLTTPHPRHIGCPGIAEPEAEVAHVVADDSDDPEHVDDCPGCTTAPDLSGYDVRCPGCRALLGQFVKTESKAAALAAAHTCPTPDLRQRYAAAIRAAVCPEAEDDECCAEAAARCFFGHLRPIRWTGNQATRIDGTPEQFADACATVRDDALTTAQREAASDREAARLALEQRQEMAAERYALQQRAEAAEQRVAADAIDTALANWTDRYGGTTAILDYPQIRADLAAHLATALGTAAAQGSDVAAPDAELTIYRAEHGSIPFGLYTTRDAARAHCEAYIRREFGDDVPLTWIPDDGSDDAPEELSVYVGDDRENTTGYVVTPLTVAAAYDPDGDE